MITFKKIELHSNQSENQMQATRLLLILSLIAHSYINAADHGKQKAQETIEFGSHPNRTTVPPLSTRHTVLYELEQRSAWKDSLEQQPSWSDDLERRPVGEESLEQLPAFLYRTAQETLEHNHYDLVRGCEPQGVFTHLQQRLQEKQQEMMHNKVQEVTKSCAQKKKKRKLSNESEDAE